MTQILVIEDEERIAAFLAKGLRAAGYAVVHAGTGRAGIALALSGDADLVILDLGLPDLDGLVVLRSLRELGVTVPIIILTARDGVSDTVEGLDAGADDYMAKPFRFEELLARVRLRLRSARSERGAGDPAGEMAVLVHEDLRLDLRTRRLEHAGGEVELSAREFSLAETFLRHPRQVLSREQLLARVWGYDHDPGSNVVEVYVGYLRRKIGADRLETVRGMGYRLR